MYLIRWRVHPSLGSRRRAQHLAVAPFPSDANKCVFDSVIIDLRGWMWSVFKDNIRVLRRSPRMKAVTHLECFRVNAKSFSIRKS